MARLQLLNCPLPQQPSFLMIGQSSLDQRDHTVPKNLHPLRSYPTRRHHDHHATRLRASHVKYYVLGTQDDVKFGQHESFTSRVVSAAYEAYFLGRKHPPPARSSITSKQLTTFEEGRCGAEGLYYTIATPHAYRKTSCSTEMHLCASQALGWPKLHCPSNLIAYAIPGSNFPTMHYRNLHRDNNGISGTRRRTRLTGKQ